jgi:hypothetical protein
MSYYIFDTDPDFDCLLLDDETDGLALNRQFACRPLRHGWRAPKVRLSPMSRHDGEFFGFYYHIPVLAERATAALKCILQDCCELLPLDGSRPLWALSVLECLDALNAEASEFDLDADGEPIDVRSYVFNESVASGHHVFKLRGFELGNIVVSDEFRRAVLGQGLAGARFRAAAIPAAGS